MTRLIILALLAGIVPALAQDTRPCFTTVVTTTPADDPVGELLREQGRRMLRDEMLRVAKEYDELVKGTGSAKATIKPDKRK